jgi:hypothetical protein
VLLAVLAVLGAMLTTLGGSLGGSPAAAQGTIGIGGTIDGSDGRAVNALIGIDLQDASGQVLDKNGCVRSPSCPVNSYGVVVNVNRTLPAEGSADTSTATISWSAELPDNTANVYIEVYPKNQQGVTTESRYGHAMRHNISVPTMDPVDLHLPLICSQGGLTGAVRGTATKNGAPIGLKRAIAWSIDQYDAVQRPTLGWNVGTVSGADGTYVVPNLASGQRYQVWTTTTDGEVHKEIGVEVFNCTETTSDPSFDPPPSPSPDPSATATATASPPPPPPPPPTVENGSGIITAGQSASMSGAADPGSTVDLYAYSRPSTDYVRVRSTTASGTGAYSFVVAPRTNTRLKVRVGGQDSDSIVVGVRPLITLRAVRTAAYTYTFTGQVLPRRPGQLVSVYARTPSGDRLVGRGAVGSDGVWRAGHRFTVAGSFPLYATTTGDLTNYAGRSPTMQLAVK